MCGHANDTVRQVIASEGIHNAEMDRVPGFEAKILNAYIVIRVLAGAAVCILRVVSDTRPKTFRLLRVRAASMLR